MERFVNSTCSRRRTNEGMSLIAWPTTSVLVIKREHCLKLENILKLKVWVHPTSGSD